MVNDRPVGDGRKGESTWYWTTPWTTPAAYKYQIYIVKHGLMAVHIPSRLEPTGFTRSDGKRPDGATVAPWKFGCLLVWDATCPDTCLAASYSACHQHVRGARKMFSYLC